MNWGIYLTTAGLIITGAATLHQLLIKKKDATIETLTEKNKWLEKQLEISERKSPDILTDLLGKRISHLEGELLRLSTDHETNQALIKSKEEELNKAREIMSEVARELGIRSGEFHDFRSNYVCAYCESRLTTLKDINDEDWTGSLREYACGHTEIDGVTQTMCPCDPNYPPFEEFEIISNSRGNSWSAYKSGKTLRARQVPHLVVFGKTKEEAESRIRFAFEDEQAKCKERVSQPESDEQF